MKTLEREKAGFSKHTAAQLVAGYSEESVLYQMLFGLTSRQRRCLGDGGNLTEFVELIDQKDAILGQVEQLERELDPLRVKWLTAAPVEREHLAKQLNPLFDEIIQTIQKTVTLEHDNERLLELRRRELSQALTDLKRWRLPSARPVVQHAASESVAAV